MPQSNNKQVICVEHLYTAVCKLHPDADTCKLSCAPYIKIIVGRIESTRKN